MINHRAPVQNGKSKRKKAGRQGKTGKIDFAAPITIASQKPFHDKSTHTLFVCE